MKPLHQRIRDDVERAILSGRLAPGERLPVESALCERYGCARMTVSKALSALAAAGLIERRKRAGSFVARPRVHALALAIPDLAAEVRARGCAYAFRPVARAIRRARGEEEGALGGELLEVEGIHLADGRPIAHEARLVNLAAVPAIRDVDFGQTAPGSWLLEHVPWTEAETRIAAAAARGKLARALSLEEGAPCLVIERRTWRGLEGITSVRQHFDASAYDLVGRFGPPRD